jgi:hypothetical protein
MEILHAIKNNQNPDIPDITKNPVIPDIPKTTDKTTTIKIENNHEEDFNNIDCPDSKHLDDGSGHGVRASRHNVGAGLSESEG